MKSVIYVDELIFINIIVNYFLLISSAFLSRSELKRVRILLGAVAGGISSLTVFLPQIPIFLSIPMKALIAALIVLISFKASSTVKFLRMYISFFVVNFIFAGTMLGIWLLVHPNGMFYNNGTVYFDINIGILVTLTVICYCVILVVSKLFKNRAPEQHFGTAEIFMLEKSVQARALLDTGNSLTDSFTGKPVIIAERETVKKLLPKELDSFFNGVSISDCDIPIEWNGRLRLIPYNSVGSKGLIPAFRCDRIIAECGGKKAKVENIFVGVTTDCLSLGEYSVILSNAVFDNNIIIQQNKKERYAK